MLELLIWTNFSNSCSIYEAKDNQNESIINLMLSLIFWCKVIIVKAPVKMLVKCCCFFRIWQELWRIPIYVVRVKEHQKGPSNYVIVFILLNIWSIAIELLIKNEPIFYNWNQTLIAFYWSWDGKINKTCLAKNASLGNGKEKKQSK